MIDSELNARGDQFDIAEVERRVKAIFIGWVGNLVEQHHSAMHRHE